MEWIKALAYWEQDQRISGRSPDSIRTWRSYLRRFGRFCDPLSATHFEVRAWLDENAHWSPSCQKAARTALRSFYGLMKAEGWVRRNPMKRVPKGAKVQRRAQPRADGDQVVRGLSGADPQVRLMVALAGVCGLRRTEISQVHTRDLVDGGLTVHGKGDKERWVPLPPWLFQELAEVGDGWVFPGRFTGHLHPATVQKQIKTATGMPPHALRRWFADRVYDEGEDLFALQQLLGHESVATTEIYVSVRRERLRRAAGAADPHRAWDWPDDPPLAMVA